MRKPAVAGMFYPKDKKILVEMISGYLRDSVKKEIKGIKAIIVPHAGYIYSGIVAGAGFRLVKGFQKIILLGPSHRVTFYGGLVDSHAEWETPLGVVKVEKFSSSLITENEMAHMHEHSLEVEVPFLQTVLKKFTLYPICMGSEQKGLAEEIIHTQDEHTLIVISSDLSHYLPYQEAVEKDKRTIQKILKFQKVDHDEACGADPINTIIEIANIQGWKATLLDYKNSGDTTGDKERVVGYGAIAFY